MELLYSVARLISNEQSDAIDKISCHIWTHERLSLAFLVIHICTGQILNHMLNNQNVVAATV